MTVGLKDWMIRCIDGEMGEIKMMRYINIKMEKNEIVDDCFL
jgi:hypothetical protein